MSENKKDAYVVFTTFQTIQHINNPVFEMSIEKADKAPNPREPKEIFDSFLNPNRNWFILNGLKSLI